MTVSPAELRSRLQGAIERSELDATELARRIGRSPEYVRDFLNGRKNSLKLNDIILIEGTLGVPEGYLMWQKPEIDDYIIKSISHTIKTIPSKRTPPKPYTPEEYDELVFSGKNYQGEGALPVYSSNSKHERCLEVSTDPIEFVLRPWFLREVREGFAILISGESFEPAFYPGDMVIINPRLPLVRDKNVILSRGGLLGSFEVSIGRLLRWSHETWTMRHYDHNDEVELTRQNWPYAFRIAGKVESP